MSDACDRCGDGRSWRCETVEILDGVWAFLCPACRAEEEPDDAEFTVRVEWTVSKNELVDSYHRSVAGAFQEKFVNERRNGETWTLLLEDGSEAHRLPDDSRTSAGDVER